MDDMNRMREETEKQPHRLRRSERHAGGEAAGASAQQSAGGETPEPTRRIPEVPRVSVGYAPGRMNMPPRSAQEIRQELQAARRSGPDPRDPRNAAYGQRAGYARYGQSGRDGQYAQYARDPRDPRRMPQGANRGPGGPEDRQPPREERSPVLWVIAAVLLVIGFALTAALAMPEDNSVRIAAGNLARNITAPVANILQGNKNTPVRIESFSVTGNDKVTAPADVIFSVTTETAAVGLRLTDQDGKDLGAAVTKAENSDANLWSMTFRVSDGYSGSVRLQSIRDGGRWVDTDYTAKIEIAPPLAPEEKPESTETGTGTAGSEDGDPENAAGDGARSVPEDEDAGDAPEDGADGSGADPEDYGDSMWGVAWGEAANPAPELTPEPTPAPTDTPEPTPEPTPTPALEAEADPSADPALITTTTVYSGKNKQKNYVRPAKNLIHMPAGEDYTAQKIGVLTFRGNAFRQNAAVGDVSGAGTLTQIWSTPAGSAKGATETFYGYTWTGQPAIVKWSTQVRAMSNIDEEKRTKNALREVIIAGVDGVIRFIDLEDGVLTRDTINQGYPFKGTPSVHPAGYPYMNVGQYTRKMKSRTGSIGLRQYNLYTQKEQGLIDGLDGKLHRGINRYGSFETSALIDRSSDTVVTLGTNGLLYLIHLDTAFDYKAGTLKTSPTTIVMSARAKGEKKNELVAVESSHAMYDRYVFYADMGGVLRCVDTNFLKPVWAVNTEDAVMAAVALDLSGEGTLDLYTANMLKNRKKGDAQIRKYNALSGKELWKTEIGVVKNGKEEVGVKASPVIGQHALSSLVYYTVTGLSDSGRAALGVAEGTRAALVALDKETGAVKWAKALSDRSESSPVAVYDKAGNGWIIQCAEDGKIIAVEGLTGKQTAELQLEGKIQASPAVYNDIMVIGTTGKGTESVTGIRIGQ